MTTEQTTSTEADFVIQLKALEKLSKWTLSSVVFMNVNVFYYNKSY